MKNLPKINFTIANWRAVSHKMVEEAQWQSWAMGKNIDHFADYQPKLPFLPAMQRRRLSPLARLFMDAAWPLLDKNNVCPVIFVSHDGEINRSFQLWRSLLQENTVSPTSFGLSVHNALVGQWSMLRGDMSENTAICAQEDGFEVAMIEAYTMLAEGVAKVLVVAADDPLSDDYAVCATRAPFAYATAFLVEKGNDWTLSLESKTTPFLIEQKQYWGALNWICQHLLLQAQYKQYAFRQPYALRQWQWQKNNGL